jgi:hypothetical protein
MFTEELAWLSPGEKELINGRAVCDWLGGNLASSPRPARSRGVPDASGGMGGTAIDLRWTWAQLGGSVRAQGSS